MIVPETGGEPSDANIDTWREIPPSIGEVMSTDARDRSSLVIQRALFNLHVRRGLMKVAVA